MSIAGEQGGAALAWGAEMRLDLAKLAASPSLAPGFRFGPLDLARFEELVDLYSAAYQGGPEATAFPEMLRTRKHCAESLRSHVSGKHADPARSLLVLQGERIAGYLAATSYSRGSACIANIAVHPDFRRAGLGRAMLVEALWRFRNAGFERVDLNVLTSNVPALSLYESLGFRDFRWELLLGPRD